MDEGELEALALEELLITRYATPAPPPKFTGNPTKAGELAVSKPLTPLEPLTFEKDPAVLMFKRGLELAKDIERKIGLDPTPSRVPAPYLPSPGLKIPKIGEPGYVPFDFPLPAIFDDPTFAGRPPGVSLTPIDNRPLYPHGGSARPYRVRLSAISTTSDCVPQPPQDHDLVVQGPLTVVTRSYYTVFAPCANRSVTLTSIEVGGTGIFYFPGMPGNEFSLEISIVDGNPDPIYDPTAPYNPTFPAPANDPHPSPPLGLPSPSPLPSPPPLPSPSPSPFPSPLPFPGSPFTNPLPRSPKPKRKQPQSLPSPTSTKQREGLRKPTPLPFPSPSPYPESTRPPTPPETPVGNCTDPCSLTIIYKIEELAAKTKPCPECPPSPLLIPVPIAYVSKGAGGCGTSIRVISALQSSVPNDLVQNLITSAEMALIGCKSSNPPQQPETVLAQGRSTMEQQLFFSGSIDSEVVSVRLVIVTTSEFTQLRGVAYPTANQRAYGVIGYSGPVSGGGEEIEVFSPSHYYRLPRRFAPGKVKILLKPNQSWVLYDTGERL